MNERQKNQDRYAFMIQEKLNELIIEEIDRSEFENGENLTDFIHALANQVPTVFYNNITGNNISALDFNHIANRLCFQNSTIID